MAEEKNEKVALWVLPSTKARAEALGTYTDTHEDIVRWLVELAEDKRLNRMIEESSKKK